MKRLWIPVALVIAACVGAVPAQANDPPPPTPVNFTDGVASGDVTSSRAILWTRVDGPARVSVEVYKSPSLALWTLRSSGRTTTDASRDFTVKIDVKALRPSTQYWYRFRSGANTSPVGTFKTAPRAHDQDCWKWWSFGCDTATNPNVNFGYTGDFDTTKVPPGGAPSHPGTPPEGSGGAAKVLDALRGENPDFWSYLGDTVYQDSRFRGPCSSRQGGCTPDPTRPPEPDNPTGPGPAMTLADYRATYREQRSYPAVQAILAATSTYAQWDDHEVLNDFTAETVDPARYAAGRKAFLENMPIREKFLHDPSCKGDPMYRTFSWGDAVDLFIPDERSCRSHESVQVCQGDLAPTLPDNDRATFFGGAFFNDYDPNTPGKQPPPGCRADINDPSRTILGPVQKARLKQDLLRSDAQYKFIINEDPIQQFFVLPYDRWEGYAAERNEMLDFIRDNSIQNVEFLTTDTHATLQAPVYKDFFSDQQQIAHEMVTGPIGTETFQQEVIANRPNNISPFIAVFAIHAFFNAYTKMECRNIDKYSYAKVDVTAGGTTTITSKDDTGATVLNNTDGAPPPPSNSPACTKTYGP